MARVRDSVVGRSCECAGECEAAHGSSVCGASVVALVVEPELLEAQPVCAACEGHRLARGWWSVGGEYTRDDAACRSEEPTECALMREREVAGRSEAIPACAVHGAHPLVGRRGCA